ncbi:hypothetical protein HXX76_010240 [Chlamydomonas incerta]|uniref:Major facilitator superfamily (MFS) profile domain-containing protein n=1 Tax=Chlamydomonas incerta TaxID=51695 RepID=A0A835SQU5_CHLIN|nr:hypothetical protein HXX76_010240 [Chlamydomonas incerta]|eukprot:KAG2430141.1 hypothetical protein HXX76_010240 [Chlamydomonas incerta]
MAEWRCVAPDGQCGADPVRALLARSSSEQPLQLPPAAPTTAPAAPAPVGPKTAPAPGALPPATAAATGAAGGAAAAERRLRSSSGAAGATADAALPAASSMCELSNGAQYVWTQPTLTLASEYNLVCGDTWKVSLLETLFFGGFMAGNGIFGRMADRHGRRATMAGCAAATAALTALSAAPHLVATGPGVRAAEVWAAADAAAAAAAGNSSSSGGAGGGAAGGYGGGGGFYVNMVLRCLSGVACAGQALGAYVLATELVGPAWRGTAGMLTQTFYIFGEFLLVGLSLALPAWRHLTLATALGCGLVAALVPLVPESPRWLLLHGRHRQAHAALMWMARLNRRPRSQPLPAFSCTPEGDICLHRTGGGGGGSRSGSGPGAGADAAEQGRAGSYARASLTEGLMRGGGSREGSGKSENGVARASQLAAAGDGVFERRSELGLASISTAAGRLGESKGGMHEVDPDGAEEQEEEEREEREEREGRGEKAPLFGSSGTAMSAAVAAAPAAAAAAVAGACATSGSSVRAAPPAGHAAGGFGSPAARGSKEAPRGHDAAPRVARSHSGGYERVLGDAGDPAARLAAATAGGDAAVADGAAAAAAAHEAEAGSLRLILAHSVTRSLLLSASFVMFALSVAYYGVTLALGTLAGSLHLNFFLTSVAELPGYLAIAATTDKLGRRVVIGGGTALAGVACLLCAFASGGPIQVALAMAGKLGCSGAWAVGLTFAAELFPTSLRSVALSVASQSGDLGGLVTPLLLLLGPEGSRLERLPFAVMGLMALAAVALVWRLPETRGMPQMETFEELLAWLRRRGPGVSPDADHERLAAAGQGDGLLAAGTALEAAALAGSGRGQLSLSRSASRDRSGSSKGRAKTGGSWTGLDDWACDEAVWLRMEAGGDVAVNGGHSGPAKESAPLLERRLTSSELELPTVKP